MRLSRLNFALIIFKNRLLWISSVLKKLLIGDFTWKRLLKSLIFIYIFFAVYVYFRADSMIFLPQPSSYQDTKEILKLTNTDKKKISAVHLLNFTAKYK
jgi:hypothetical protein